MGWKAGRAFIDWTLKLTMLVAPGVQKGRKKFEAVSCEDSASAATSSGSLKTYPKTPAALKIIDAVGTHLPTPPCMPPGSHLLVALSTIAG
jgi:hypothetical protein|eukprot:COSAG02_NODE_4942_length_4806_cov_2.678989_2_plen_91_part_00